MQHTNNSNTEPVRPLLTDITDASYNATNTSPTMPSAKTSFTPEPTNYFQQQYHSAVMQDAINAHAQFLQLQEHGYAAQAYMMQQQMQQGGMPAHGNGSIRRGSRVSPTQRPAPNQRVPSRRSSPTGVPSSHHHAADDSAHPCDCPDCNLRRLQEVMCEATVSPMAHGYPQQQQRSPYAPPMVPHHLEFEHAVMYGMQPNLSPMMRGNSMPVSPLHMDHYAPTYDQLAPLGAPAAPVAERQHNPYAPVSPTAPSAAAYEVPYIPAPSRDYAHLIAQPEIHTDSSSHNDSGDVEMEREVPTGRSPLALAVSGAISKQQQQQQQQQQAIPNTPAKQSAASANATPARPANAKTATPATKATPTNRRTSPAQQQATPSSTAPEEPSTTAATPPNTRRGGAKTHNASVNGRHNGGSPRPPCSAVLKLTVSPWHTNVPVAAREEFAVGDYVIFEGDRGNDLGRVTAVVAATEEAAHYPRVIAHATTAQIDEHKALAEEAAATVAPAQTAVDRAGLKMTLVGAVFQFNREKLTFMYDSAERLDFRQLVRDLYGLFRCRIWMEPISSCPAANGSSPVAPAARKPRGGSPSM